MATMPPNPAADAETPPAGPAAGAPAAEETPAGPKFTVCIYVGQDDELSVGVEGAESGGEGAAEEAAEASQAQPAANPKEALTIALYALKNGGQLPDMQGQADAFEEGFSGGPAKPGAMA